MAQLDLSDGASDQVAEHFKSYRELLAGDTELELVDGALVERQEPVFDANGDPVFLLDQNGDPILDANGQQSDPGNANGAGRLPRCLLQAPTPRRTFLIGLRPAAPTKAG